MPAVQLILALISIDPERLDLARMLTVNTEMLTVARLGRIVSVLCIDKKRAEE